MNTLILVGPQGCGKSAHSKLLAQALGCSGVVDDWWPGQPVEPGQLHLTHSPVTSIDPAVGVVLFSDERVHDAIFSARQ